ncbi:MAG: hypothetical protein EXR98_24000 [Gemmataceae bacterium]|nr:hypothetical protein [Gemmataceae bacterium]
MRPPVTDRLPHFSTAVYKHCRQCRSASIGALLGKAGVYYNHATGNAAGDVNGQPIPPVSAQADQTAFIGGVNVGASYCLGKHLSVRGGYQTLWIEGVALIPDQLECLGGPNSSIGTSGGLFLHGFFAGLELKW